MTDLLKTTLIIAALVIFVAFLGGYRQIGAFL